MEFAPVRQRGDTFKLGVARLIDAGIENPALDAAVLLGYVTGEPASTVLMDRKAVLTKAEDDRYTAVIRKRCERSAVSRIVGEREFYSRGFHVTDDVLDPRPDTEILVDEAIRFLENIKGDMDVLDVGTGSGVIAVTVAAQLPLIRVTATDISMAALAVARGNAARHGVRERLRFLQADLLNGIRIRGGFQAILSNPPYVPDDQFEDLPDEVRKGDPKVALVPGPRGIECYPVLAKGAMNLLAAGGSLMVETGAGQADTVAGMFRQSGLTDVHVVHDLAGKGRVVKGIKDNA